jgi:hypothetical protein
MVTHQQSEPDIPGRNKTMLNYITRIARRCFVVTTLFLLLSNSAHAADKMIRLVTPCKLSSEPDTKLEDQAAKTRAILGPFRESGFTGALWIVDKVPVEHKDMKSWLTTCLSAFPIKPLVAVPSSEHVEDQAFEKYQEFFRLAFEKHGWFLWTRRECGGVILNYDDNSKHTQLGYSEERAQSVDKMIGAIKAIDPNVKPWLTLDSASSQEDVKKWLQSLGDKVGGFYIQGTHNIGSVSGMNAEALRQLLATKKPIIRGDFIYVAPQLRKGLENDLQEQYSQRSVIYEKKLIETGFAGYSRVLGESIPDYVGVNLLYVPLLAHNKEGGR